jgi:hypothetical protein
VIKTIENPLATAVVHWLSPDEGGRNSGPPTTAVYAATTTFRGVPDEIEHFSILLERVKEIDEWNFVMRVGFLVPELVQPRLRKGMQIPILEGPKVVAHATLRDV